MVGSLIGKPGDSANTGAVVYRCRCRLMLCFGSINSFQNTRENLVF